MIKFLWINAIDTSSEVETRYPNLGIGYLSASLKREFGDNYFDFKVVTREVASEIDDFMPDIIGISCVSQNYDLAKIYAKTAKDRGLPVLIGGVHISFLPQTLTRDMDVGCLGEGENTIVELIKLFDRERAFPCNQLERIEGVVFFNTAGDIRITSPRPLCENLDTIPFPDFDLVKPGTHAYLFTSRGCPYRCSFCASSRFWNKVRFFSAERVVCEIDTLIKNHNANFISFFDDLFVADKSRFFRIIELLEQRNIVGKVKFSCSLRANTVTEDVVRGLRRMGVVSVGMGLESGNERVLEWLKGKNITVEQNFHAVKLLNQYGIMPNASFVIGSPHESREEILDTYNFIKKSNLGLFDVYVLTPFPGTPVWEDALKRNLVSEGPEMEWGRLNVNFEVAPEKAIILSSVLPRGEIISLYKKIRRYRLFHNAKRIWKHPMLSDLPRYLFKRTIEKMTRWSRGTR